MRHDTVRRPPLAFLALLIVLAVLPGRSLAEALIKDVSREEARELGITVRLQPRADDVRVQVEFRTAGAMGGFRYASLELVRAGKRLISSDLMPRKPTPQSPADHVQVEFYVDPAALPDATVTIVAYPEPFSGTGYRLRMKEFLPRAASR